MIPSSNSEMSCSPATMRAMVRLYCRSLHGGDIGLCRECEELMRYATLRIDRCVFGEDKPTCARCPIHCYKPARREMAREVMRYAGPRMAWRHPWLSLLHVMDKLRRVEQVVELLDKAARNLDTELASQPGRSASKAPSVPR